MPLPDPSLEPAIRDPKKLRNTAFVLVAMMLLGGWLIMLSYKQWSKTQALDDRPAVIYRITPERDLRMLRQDGKTVDLVNLRGHVIAVQVMSNRDPQTAKLGLEVMQRLAQSRAGEKNFNLVSLVLDPEPAEKLLATLATTANSLGATLPQWWVGANEPNTLQKFIYNQLKASVSPFEKDGKWQYDASIVLIDKNGHIRRAVVPQKQGGSPYIATFDFEQAAGWDAKGVKTSPADINTNVEQLEILLNHTIDKLLAEEFKN
ncbi:MAG: hypothetical protein ABIS50_12105 [Luteolibacter sp.]|uniref:hypothetical protein n=1 Tax=Luteolibacter sp. TaxID=1962973 RepID=UPI0032632F7D